MCLSSAVLQFQPSKSQSVLIGMSHDFAILSKIIMIIQNYSLTSHNQSLVVFPIPVDFVKIMYMKCTNNDKQTLSTRLYQSCQSNFMMKDGVKLNSEESDPVRINQTCLAGCLGHISANNFLIHR